MMNMSVVVFLRRPGKVPKIGIADKTSQIECKCHQVCGLAGKLVLSVTVPN
jgi:hypothetical protein